MQRCNWGFNNRMNIKTGARYFFETGVRKFQSFLTQTHFIDIFKRLKLELLIFSHYEIRFSRSDENWRSLAPGRIYREKRLKASFFNKENLSKENSLLLVNNRTYFRLIKNGMHVCTKLWYQYYQCKEISTRWNRSCCRNCRQWWSYCRPNLQTSADVIRSIPVGSES